ncbi:MAG: hypothetical protein ACOY82_00075 [Pseudomonadota bacterium]
MFRIHAARCLTAVAVLSATVAVCAQTPTPVRKAPPQAQTQPQPQPHPSAAGTLTGPDDPVPTRPDPDVGEVDQAQRPTRSRVDLALIGAFSLGGAQIPWGTIATIEDTAASAQSNGRCVFAYRYSTRNQGALASVPTQNRILLGAQAGPIIASLPLPALAAGTNGASSGKLVLVPGESMLYVHADGSATNAESDEANNLRRVRVTVKGDCR